LQPDELQGFLDFLLNEDAIAKRDSNRLQKNDKRMVGKHICRSADGMRVEDFRERLWVGFQACKETGKTNSDACVELGDLRSVKRRLIWSKPRQCRPDTYRVAETIRSSVSRFKRTFKGALFNQWVGQYRLFQIHQDAVAEYERLAQPREKSPKGIPQYTTEEYERIAQLKRFL